MISFKIHANGLVFIPNSLPPFVSSDAQLILNLIKDSDVILSLLVLTI